MAWRWAALGVTGAYACTRLVLALRVVPIRFADTPTYLQLDFTSRAIRLVTVPLVYRLAPTDTARVIVQAIASGLSWSGLAAAFHTVVRSQPVALAAAGLALMVGLTPQITSWDPVLLSESLSISLSVAFVAAAMLAVSGVPNRWVLPLSTVLGGLWIMARDVNGPTLLVVLVGFTGVAVFRPSTRSRLVRRPAICAVLAVLAAGGLAALFVESGPGHRGIRRLNALNIVELRLLPSQRSALTRAQFPFNADVDSDVGVGVRGPTDPVLADLAIRRWIDDRFAHFYGDVLLSHVGTTLTRPAGLMLAGAAKSPGYGPTYHLPVGFLQATPRRRQVVPLLFDCLPALVPAAWFVRRRAKTAFDAVDALALAVMATGYGLAVLGWTLAAAEASRELSPPAVVTLAGLLLFIVHSLDRVFSSAVVL